MTGTRTGPTIVVPVNVEEPEEPPPGLVKLLHPHRLVLLGYYPVPDQASPEQFQAEFEEEATTAIEEIASHFTAGDNDIASVVVFTRDRSATIDRIATEHEADAVLTGGLMGERLERLLVPLKGDANIERIVAFVGDLLANSDASVTLYHVVDADEEESTGEFLLRGASDRLREDGVDPDRIEWTQERSETPSSAIVAAGEAYDLIVVGESNPTLRDRILGLVTSRVIETSTHPVLIVRGG